MTTSEIMFYAQAYFFQLVLSIFFLKYFEYYMKDSQSEKLFHAALTLKKNSK